MHRAAEKRRDAPRLEATRRASERQREWFTSFRSRVMEGGEPYVIAGAVAPHEIFHAMDVPVVATPWYSAVIAAKQLSPQYFGLMDQLGYHAHLPRYESLPLMSTLANDPETAPYGGLPKPALLVDRLRGEARNGSTASGARHSAAYRYSRSTTRRRPTSSPTGSSTISTTGNGYTRATGSISRSHNSRTSSASARP